MTRSASLALVLLAGAAPVAACQSRALRPAAASITAADVRRRIFIIADDSMGGRNTPSAGLDKTAAYIAGEFRRLGLTPGGDSGGYLQRYPIASRRVLPEGSTLELRSGTARLRTTLAEGAALVAGPTSATVTGGVVWLGGVVIPDSLKAEDIRDKVVVLLPGQSEPSDLGIYRTLQKLERLGAGAVVMVTASDSMIASYQHSQLSPSVTAGDGEGGTPILAIRAQAIVAQLPEAVSQLRTLRAASSMVVRAAPGWSAELALRDTALTIQYAPNVVGILEGSDPVLRSEYVIFSAHMDHIGTSGEPGAQCQAAGADSICNGADDDGSGTVGVLELAEAFTRPGAQPGARWFS